MPAVDLSVPMVVMDYAFLRDNGEERTITIIVARDRQTRVTTAAQVPMKGASEKWSTNVICRFIDKLGHTKTTLMNDQEKALEAVARAVKVKREHPTLLQNSPKGESQSNGVVENAAQ